MAACVVLVICGVFVLGFLGEPSAVGRMRGGLIVIGGGLIVVGLAAGAFGVRILVARRT